MYRITLVWLTLFAFIGALPCLAEDIREASVLELRPTQPAAGYTASETSQLRKYRMVSTEQALRAKVLQEKPLRAVIGPGGALYLTDGHHRALGVFRASSVICEASRPSDQQDACMAGIKVKVLIDGDYSQKSWDQFLAELEKENNIYLPPASRTRVASKEITAEQVFRQPDGLLPPNLGKIANDPMRSAIGTLFYHQGISGDLFVNYVEFLVAEQLGESIKVEPGLESDLGVQIRLMKAVFNNPAVLRYLRCQARKDDESWKKAQQQINLAVGLDPAVPFASSACDLPKGPQKVPDDAVRP